MIKAVALSIIIVLVFMAVGLGAKAEGTDQERGRGLERLSPRFSYESGSYCSAGIKEQDGRMGYTTHQLDGVWPLLNEKDLGWDLFFGVGVKDMDDSAVLPESGRGFPESLWDIEVGTSMRKVLENDWVMKGSVAVGSPSDRPFDSFEEVAISGHLLFEVPWRDHLDWLLMLNVSNTRGFLPYVPLPGAGLRYYPEKSFRGVLGVPFSMLYWSPAAGWEVEGSYILLTTVHAKIGYWLTEEVKVFGGFDWESEYYFRHDRRDEEDMLSFYEKRVAGGLEWVLSKGVSVELASGYAFDRFWFEGEDYDDRNQNRIDLGDGVFAEAKLVVRF